MAVSITFNEHGVERVDGEHVYEALFAAYMLGRLPPVATKTELNARLKKWAAWIELNVDLGDEGDDDDGGEEVKRPGEP